MHYTNIVRYKTRYCVAKMSDYSESIIYKLHNDDLPEFYIGSTHDEIQRKIQHKSNCNNENDEKYNLNVYEFIRANGGYDNWKFEVLEHYHCDNDIQLRIRERYYYDLFNPELNMIRPYVSEEELKEYQTEYQTKYREENKEELKEYNAKYYLENTVELQKKQKQKHNCECGGKYTISNKQLHCKSKKHTKYIETNSVKLT